MAKICHSLVFLSNSSGAHLAPPTNLMVPAKSHSVVQMPGVVGSVVVVVTVVVDLGVVVVVVVVVLVVAAAARACSKSFSMDMGVVDGVGHPVNSVVAL